MPNEQPHGGPQTHTQTQTQTHRFEHLQVEVGAQAERGHSFGAAADLGVEDVEALSEALRPAVLGERGCGLASREGVEGWCISP